jgi:PKHD-type hydroxylase
VVEVEEELVEVDPVGQEEEITVQVAQLVHLVIPLKVFREERVHQLELVEVVGWGLAGGLVQHLQLLNPQAAMVCHLQLTVQFIQSAAVEAVADMVLQTKLSEVDKVHLLSLKRTNMVQAVMEYHQQPLQEAQGFPEFLSYLILKDKSQMNIMRGFYNVIKNLISPEEADEISKVIKKAPKNEGDPQVPNSHSYYNLPVCNILLGRLLDRVSKKAGKTLSPSYAYCRVCFRGADLKPHKDRPSCEYSVTLNLSQTHQWTIFMGKKGITQNPGDGVLYKGCEIEHSRPEFNGDEYVQVFLHYVDSNGPYKDHVYDTKKDEPTQNIYRFLFGTNFFANQTDYYRYIDAIPVPKVNELRQILDTKELHDAQIGDNGGTVSLSKRRSKVFWLPKTDEFLEIYKVFHELISKCNAEFYQFKLTEITENIQYTVYNSEDQGYYDWHIDMGPGKANRKLSLVCQLSEPSEYEGGELQINTGDIIVPEKEKGTVILFPSYLLHRVTPVTKGTRRSLVLWIEGPAFV